MINYRLMTIEDVEAVHAIEVDVFPTPWTLNAFYQEMTSNTQAHYIVAVDDTDKIIGFCGMWIVFDDSQITNVAVLPEGRGKGIGEALMRHAIALSKDKKVNVMSLEVRVTNIVAQNLYRKLGFSDGGIRKGYYTDNQEDALVMWVNL
ncbi:ribosomal protein S18-alanine N-acetyltransferase [Kurthia sibirica]|uniref:[Ribosomal protein bS18]-alanine N-acetyltransferase n=1 Tax=Kurthia sibirica TaxID=202750 RepID=A0A2U3AJ98_9BACL|nr:ribosomal protein S18-alanine N-acetyltransferase [Kurthia sibirica]PWI24551.1 ribosomal-protein-alanine N-acetyltransferase [Kurthia sibirica]GEK33501.1 ribosomal-protein-alanine acetyltransferase [Kurthia sibirica]